MTSIYNSIGESQTFSDRFNIPSRPNDIALSSIDINKIAVSHSHNGVIQNLNQSLSVSLVQQSVNGTHLSTDLNTRKDITNDTSLTLIHTSEQDINNVDNKENTKNELDNVEKAIEQYNRRMDKVLKSDVIKDKLDKEYQCEEKILDLMNNVQKALHKAIREINNQDINDTEKREKIMALHNAVEDAILSDNEKNILKVLKNNITNTLDFKTLRV
jgi:hypothetical protein